LKPDLINDWDVILSKYKKKNYLPLINFPTGKDDKNTKKRNEILTSVCRSMETIAKLPLNYYSGISYLITEITDNIVDHSEANRGWISFQYYRQKGYIDLCIADSGKGFLKAYQDYRGKPDYSHITTHIDALDNVLKGNSTKSSERGFGVHTSSRMLIDGLNGHFTLLSGSALLVNKTMLDISYCYDGALSFLRIPCRQIIGDFDIMKFV
jgi:hypothetical protein